MRVVRHSTPQSFQQQAVPFLLQREATHNLILGVVSRFAEGFPEDAYFAHVENNMGEVVAAAMLTPPNGAVLSAVTDKRQFPCWLRIMRLSMTGCHRHLAQLKTRKRLLIYGISARDNPTISTCSRGFTS
jgi:hypothetical protein